MAYAETSLRTATIKDKFQFQRIGYFCLDKTSNKKQLYLIKQ